MSVLLKPYFKTAIFSRSLKVTLEMSKFTNEVYNGGFAPYLYNNNNHNIYIYIYYIYIIYVLSIHLDIYNIFIYTYIYIYII